MKTSCKTALPFRENARLPASASRRHVLASIAAPLALSAVAPWANAGVPDGPTVALASVYRPGVPLAAYSASEKYDGVRGVWDGRRLYTRGGERVSAPPWFTAGWPSQAMDGELWAGYGQFAQAVSTVRTQVPDDAAWNRMRFMVFDLPSEPGNFAARSAALAHMVAAIRQPWLQAVRQFKVSNQVDLDAAMNRFVREGGEGIMLRRLDAPWRAGRTQDLLKYKPDQDADARVLAHVAGQGKYAGAMGALWVETPEGLRFKLGTGFNDATRRNPPAIGTWLSYRYRGETSSGLPRFASYLRIRADRSDRDK